MEYILSIEKIGKAIIFCWNLFNHIKPGVFRNLIYCDIFYDTLLFLSEKRQLYE